jgi:hypothetical protein
MATQADIAGAVAYELSAFRFAAVREWASGLLVPPSRHIREWDYGPPGQRFECWLIVRLPHGHHGIVYSESGHADRWGLVPLDDLWFGPDSCWYLRLEDAIIAGGWRGDLPEGYEVA